MSLAAVGTAYLCSDPAADPRAFRNALGQYGTGVAVITALAGDRPVGMTVNSFAAVSLDPPLVLWSVRNDSGRAGAFLEAEGFTVNVLASDQVAVAGAVAATRTEGSAFDEFAWAPGRGGVPLVEGALARLECTLHAVLDGGDHRILVGRVEQCSVAEAEPLLFVQGGYATAAALPSPAEESAEHRPGAGANQFAHLVTAASHRLSKAFDTHRAEFGLGVATSRVLKRLADGPQTFDHLVRACYVGPRAVEDALTELVADGLVSASGEVWSQTPRGSQVRAAVAARAARFTDEALAQIPESDVAAALRVLTALAAD